MFAHHAHHEGAQGTVYTRTCPRLPPHPGRDIAAISATSTFPTDSKRSLRQTDREKDMLFLSLVTCLRSCVPFDSMCIDVYLENHENTFLRGILRGTRGIFSPFPVARDFGATTKIMHRPLFSLSLLLRDEQLSRQFLQLPSSFLNRSFSRNFRHLSSSGIEGFSSFVDI